MGGALLPKNPFSSFSWDSQPSEQFNTTLPAALQEWITSTSTTTQQLVNNLMKWKEEINNINITSHLDSFRDLTDTPLNITQTLNNAWDIVNQTLLASPKPSYAVIQCTKGLSLQELCNIVSVQGQARKLNYFYQLIYLIPQPANPSKQQFKHMAAVQKADLDTIHDLLPEDSVTVLEEREVGDILNHLFPSELPRNSALTQSPDHVLLAFLYKRGYIIAADSRNSTGSPMPPLGFLNQLFAPLKRLVRPT
ncbi:hypothetical protein EON64_01380, partial [archaeon]